jgi:hypothetical protein
MSADIVDRTYRDIVVLWSVGATITTLELLAIRDEFRPGGQFAFALLRQRGTWQSSIMRMVGGHTAVLLVVRLLLLLALVAFLDRPAVHQLCLVALTLITLVLAVRLEHGRDGSDHMSAVVLIALVIGFGPLGDAFLRTAALIFVAAQLCLAYGAAGVAKLVSPTWRRGTALALILDTDTYGHASSAAWLRCHPRIGELLTRSVIVAEVLFGLGLVVVLPAPWAWLLLVWGVLFHTATAVLMGLNTFLWAFVAAYPAIVYVQQLVHS